LEVPLPRARDSEALQTLAVVSTASQPFTIHMSFRELILHRTFRRQPTCYHRFWVNQQQHWRLNLRQQHQQQHNRLRKHNRSDEHRLRCSEQHHYRVWFHEQQHNRRIRWIRSWSSRNHEWHGRNPLPTSD
jgi:hypothetical protein